MLADPARRGARGSRAWTSPGPGFLNVVLDAAAAGELARTIVEARPGLRPQRRSAPASGSTSSSSPRTRPGRSTSAAPGGPRSATASPGSSRRPARSVTREYYFNDHGAQIDRFARSLLARAKGEPTPEDGYGGAVHRRHRGPGARRRRGGRRARPPYAARRRGAGGLPRPRRRPDVRRDQGVAARLRRRLRRLLPRERPARVRRGRTGRSTGCGNWATSTRRTARSWLRTTDFGDDKDRVVIKSDGDAAYIAGDLAYYLDKRERGFDRVVIMLGADHHGYIGRMMAMCAAFGDTPGRQPRDPHRADGQPGQGRPAGPDEQAGRHRRHAGGPRRRRRRGRRPVRPRPLLGGLARSTSTSTCSSSTPTTTRSTTCSTRTPGIAGIVAQRAEASACGRADAFDPALLDHETESVLLGRARRVPARRRAGRRAARAAPGGALPRGARRALPQVVRRLPGHPTG